MKLNLSGELLWGTFFGGEEKDAVQAITIDDNDNLYILGTTSSTSNIATPNSFQESFGGAKDVFIAKMSPTGILNWSTYYGNEYPVGVDNPRQFTYLLMMARVLSMSCFKLLPAIWQA